MGSKLAFSIEVETRFPGTKMENAAADPVEGDTTAATGGARKDIAGATIVTNHYK